MYNDWLGLVWSDTDDVFLGDNLFLLSSTAGYITPKGTQSPYDEPKIAFLFPIHQSVKFQHIDNENVDNQVEYSVKMSFEEFADFYEKTGKEDYNIDYAGQRITYYGLMSQNTDYYAIELKFENSKSADSIEYGRVVCTALSR